jgi:transcriptional regulator with XRE-family HTH domain
MHYDCEEFREALAARIKALRKAKGWTQMQMTTDFGYHVSFWQSAAKDPASAPTATIGNTPQKRTELLLSLHGSPRMADRGLYSTRIEVDDHLLTGF